jgi:hypothetical protein
VTYYEMVRDEKQRVLRTQHLSACELEMNARVIDSGSRDPYQSVLATGPGTVRLWQSGLKDEAGPRRNPPMPDPDVAKNTGKDTEMKSTIVTFAGRMHARDYGSVYQDATFVQQIELFHGPSERDDAEIDRNRLPPGWVTLKCADKLIVSSRKNPGGTAAQSLHGYGNAWIRTDEYDGWGEKVTSDGPTVTLEGGENTLAHINNRFNMNRFPGKKIVYDRMTGYFKVDEAAVGTFEQGPKK